MLNESTFDALDIPHRPALLGDWFLAGDLGFIYAPRGGGKTWIALALARALAEGGKCGPWQAHVPVKCLYVDGEMPLDEMRKRNQSLRGAAGDNLIFLSHQRNFDVGVDNLCLTDPESQNALTEFCVETGIKVLYLDNLSTLFTRVEENKADAWRDSVEGWLLKLRRHGVAVVIIAHAGRNGEMRGTSKREDCAFWQICLEPMEKSGEGVRFTSRFTKNRNATEDPPPLKWHFRPDNGRVVISWEEADALQILRAHIEGGLETCSEIAEDMGIAKSTVSKLAKQAERAGWLKITGTGNQRHYKLKTDA